MGRLDFLGGTPGVDTFFAGPVTLAGRPASTTGRGHLPPPDTLFTVGAGGEPDVAPLRIERMHPRARETNRMVSEPIRVLFVCLGNICRSPLAEGVFRQLVAEEGVADRFELDSAGTSSYHTGESPDARAAKVARGRGVALGGQARQMTEEDIRRSDYLIVMDTDNLADVERLAERLEPGAELHLLREFDPEAAGEIEVPDPYYGGPQGFERVHDIVERSCRGLLEHIRGEHAL